MKNMRINIGTKCVLNQITKYYEGCLLLLLLLLLDAAAATEVVVNTV